MLASTVISTIIVEDASTPSGRIVTACCWAWGVYPGHSRPSSTPTDRAMIPRAEVESSLALTFAPCVSRFVQPLGFEQSPTASEMSNCPDSPGTMSGLPALSVKSSPWRPIRGPGLNVATPDDAVAAIVPPGGGDAGALGSSPMLRLIVAEENVTRE